MSGFHKGEKQIQKLAGVSEQAEQMTGMMQNSLAPAAVQFLLGQRLVAITTIGKEGAVWVSALIGEPGFIYPISPAQIIIDAKNLPRSDILWQNLSTQEGMPGGMVVLNFALRRRLRVNCTLVAKDQFLIATVTQTYSNCPKYIQKRQLESTPSAETINKAKSSQRAVLDDTDRSLIESSDTFFIGSYAEGSGADTSHRGGNPGFARALDDAHIRFPDYAGNNMFNTLGNLAVNPKTGLLFVDFQTGDSLQVTGRAETAAPFRWHDGEQPGHVDVSIDQVIRTSGGPLGRWKFLEYSPYNRQVQD